MPLEVFDKIGDLNELWPDGNDGVNDGDDHLRGLKLTVKNDALSLDAGGTVVGAVTFEAAATFESSVSIGTFVEAQRGVFTGTGGASSPPIQFDGTGVNAHGFYTVGSGIVAAVGGSGSARLEASGPDTTDGFTVMTREKSDARYQQDNGTLQGEWTCSFLFNAQRFISTTDGAATFPAFQTDSGSGMYHSTWLSFTDGATRTATIGDTTNVAHDWHTLMTRRKGDARYTQSLAMLKLLDLMITAGVISGAQRAEVEALMEVADP